MRIVVNDIVAVPESGGVFSVLTDFYEEVLEYSKQHSDIEWIFILSGPYIQETENVRTIIMPDLKNSKIHRLIFELITGRKVINQLHADIYLSLQNTMTMGVEAAQWAYVHQPLSFQDEIHFSLLRKGEKNLWLHQAIIGRIINYTIKHSKTKVVVQTQWMKKAILERKLTPQEDIFVLPPNNVRIPVQHGKKEMKWNDFFYPATAMKYKNHEVLFEAVRKLEKEHFKFNVICTLTSKDVAFLGLKVPSSVKLVGMIDRNRVMSYYRKRVLVFPSLLETFGLPLLEARLSGGYIIAGNTSFGNEILEGYPNYDVFDVHSASDLAEKMKLCINGEKNILDVPQQHQTRHTSLITLIQRGN